MSVKGKVKKLNKKIENLQEELPKLIDNLSNKIVNYLIVD